MYGKIHHVSVTCTDMSNSLIFYKKLGFSVVKKFNDDEVIITMIASKGTVVELFEFKKDKLLKISEKKIVNVKFIGITHFAIQVADLNIARIIFAGCCICMIISIFLFLQEIRLSNQALKYHLSDMDSMKKDL